MSRCLKIKILSARKIQYINEHEPQLVALFLERPGRALWNDPNNEQKEITTAELCSTVRQWRTELGKVIVVDERQVLQEVRLPDGRVLTKRSHLLDLVKAVKNWQRGQFQLTASESMALKLWTADRVPSGMADVDQIKDLPDDLI